MTDIFIGDRTLKDAKIDSHQKKYNSKIFSLYSSHNIKNAVENNVDNRVNIFSKKSFWLVMIGSVLFLFLAIYQVWSFLHVEETLEVNHNNINNTSLQAPVTSQPVTSQPVNSEPTYKLSSYWRITGELNNDKGRFIIIVSKDGVIRLLDRNLFFGSNLTMYGIIDNEKVTYYSGV
ncbi:hypothetical protein XBKQ1_1040001 [Xenorhabdus bovienii str. kraussei Quebec]|uniref:Uncharacterized protein n=1 Tax=Xenorhabdus bovienii str. kraussei Quebec TaxID=1398203 RepID=A0A077PEV2_XENBV|nr:hypothetical protein [Xenorhabdus bovienii]CDH18164.1 hypothetical protein XBKQ1_1040001 [Xenorhabdus bovienii str. kraussei Quebec]